MGAERIRFAPEKGPEALNVVLHILHALLEKIGLAAQHIDPHRSLLIRARDFMRSPQTAELLGAEPNIGHVQDRNGAEIVLAAGPALSFIRPAQFQCARHDAINYEQAYRMPEFGTMGHEIVDTLCQARCGQLVCN